VVLAFSLEERRAMSSLDKSNTFTDLLSVQVRERPDATAMIFGERSTSYGELDGYSNRIANGLIGLGVEKQERIGYLGRNRSTGVCPQRKSPRSWRTPGLPCYLSAVASATWRGG
jgi:non-ribosomal peptide synthetase component F